MIAGDGTGGVLGEFREQSAEIRVRELALSHLSLEVGHLYLEDLLAGPERLEALFGAVRPWADAAVGALPARRRRVSTCFLIDDYFSRLGDPTEVVPMVLTAARSTGVAIHYLVREAACAAASGPAGDVSPAELLLSQLVEEPEPGTNGWRPPVASSGWLSNGRRSPVPAVERAAMDVRAWSPPAQNAARRHSIFVDVQLWDDQAGKRTWSCPLLAAAWQLLRLGLLRHHGFPALEAVDRPDRWPSAWDRLPAIVRLDPAAPPFTAYATASILSPRFLPVEVAVRTVLGQVGADPLAAAQLERRAAAEGVPFPPDVLDRIQYVFAGEPTVDPPT